ncbi:MAG: NAD-dependent epimerase/dehydratase family protein [archaeon]
MDKEFWSEKRVLVTGGMGFVGGFLVEKLKGLGADVFTFSRNEYDLTKEGDVKRLFEDSKPQIVIHLAVDGGGIGYMKKNPGSVYDNNILMNTFIQKYARLNNVEKFYGMGTVCEYPKFTPVPFKEENLWEGYPEETNAAYGLTKKMMMVQSQGYRQQYGFNAIHLLMVNLYGPRDDFHPENSHVIPALIKKFVENKDKVEIWGTGSASREFLYVEDAVNAIILAIERYNKSEPINIGSGQETTIKELVNIIAELTNFQGEIVWDTTKPDGQPRRCLDTSKAEQEFGFKAKISFKEGLRKTIKWYLEELNKKPLKPKVELIIPSNPYLGDDMRNLPIGILYLAAVAEKNGYLVKITDLRNKKFDEIEKLIGDSDVYGINAATPDYYLSEKIAEIIKKKNPDSWIVIGGIHATANSNKISNIFDKVVIGEGELAFLDLLKDYEDKNNNKRFYQREPIENLDSVPFPARHLLPFENCFSENALFVGAGPTAAIITSRGCPNNCSFCASDIMWHQRVRFRSPDNVVEEIKEIIKYHDIKNFRIMDDTFTVNKKRLIEICEKIAPLGIRFRIETRVDYVDPEILYHLKKAGCEENAYGIESPTQEVLDKVGKNIGLEQAENIIKMTHDAGIKVRLFFIIGLPGEKPGFADRLIQFVEKTHPHAVNVSTFVPYPGSDIYTNPKKYGIKLKTEDFSIYNMTLGLKEGEIDRDFTFEHDVMTDEQLKNERRKALEYIKSKNKVMNF